MTNEDTPSPREALDEALLETHHLANLSGLDEARIARRRLVEAQSASSVHRTRDRLEEALEYLELARLERRDTAAGFGRARELVSQAQAGLGSERPVPMTGSPADLLDPSPRPRKSLEELRAEAAVNSFEQLRLDVELERTFAELRRQLAGQDDPHSGTDERELDPETAIELASLEMDIERSLQGPEEDSRFEFVGGDDLASPEDDAASEPEET